MNLLRLQSRLFERPQLAAGGALVFGLAVTLAAVMWQSRANDRVAAARFLQLGQDRLGVLAARLKIYEYGLLGARGVVLDSGPASMNRRRFEHYAGSRDIDREFPGARGTGVIWRVSPGEEAAFVEAVRRDGEPDFAIRQLSPHAGDRLVVTYVEPRGRNVQAIGFDIASEADRRTAAEAAARTGIATITAPVTFAYEGSHPHRAFLLLLPIYRAGASLDSAAERMAAAMGWTFAPLLIDQVVADLGLTDRRFALALSDRADGANPFFATPTQVATTGSALVQHVVMPVYGRNWDAEFRAGPEFFAELDLPDPRLIGLAGVLVSGLFAVLMHVFAQSARREQHVRDEQARRAAIVESSGDAIIGESLDGIVTDWNAGAERLFGYAAASAIGKPLANLLLPEGHAAEDAAIRATAARGEVVATFDTVRKHLDGSLIDVSVAASPIVAFDGRCVGIAKTVRDITAARRTEREIRELNASLERRVADRTALLEAALRENEGLLTTIRMHTIFSEADHEGRIVEVNDNFCRISGYGRAELFGQDHRIVNSGVHDRAFWLDMWRTVSSGKPWRGEICNRAKDGSLYWVDSIIAPFAGADGRIEKYISVRSDITAAKAAEQKLRASQAFLDRVGTTAGVGGWQLDLDPVALTWSAQTYRIHEIEPGTPLDVKLGISFFPGEAATTIRAAVERCVADGTGYDLELPFVTATGRALWVRAVGSAEVRDGKTLRLVGALQDITERKRAAIELHQTSFLLRTVLESASEVSIIAGDPQLQITVFNAGAQRLLGYSAEEIVGRTTPILIHDLAEVQARAQELSEQLGRPVEGGAVFTEPSTLGQPREWTYVRKDGSRVQVSLIVTAMYADDGSLFGYLGVAHDVTRQKQYQESLRQAMHKAKHASLAKSQFLANMSHEIRTPMNAVIGLTYLLGQTGLDAEQADSLNKIRIASKSLLVVINDVLDISKIEAGELTLETAPFSLRSVLHELGDMMSVEAQAKRIRFTIDAPRELPPALIGDATRLHQVLTNLVANAVKFTEHGGVTLAVQRCGDATGEVRLRFTVRDSGIGIPAAIQARLFAPFAQADTSATRRFGGTGLGLSIVKRVVTLMGGDVGLQSTPGVGSEFWVEIPFTLADAAEVAVPVLDSPSSGRRLPGVRVLIADDSEINLEVAKRILELEGATVALAENGEEAVARLRAQPDGFDLVLMDVQMPVLDGHAATRRIRDELGLTALPVIALTAGALSSEHQRATAAGMDDFVSKPFDAQGLVSTMLRHLGPVAVQARASEPPAPADGTWPEIDGIDTADVRGRLGSDVDLFRSMLMRLLKEFSDLGGMDHHPDAPALEALAARMHKLRGSASMLGARSIGQQAGHAETACRAGEGLRAVQWVRKIAAQIELLQTRSAAALERMNARADALPAVHADGPADRQVVRELIDSLNRQSMSALEQFKQIAPELRHELGDPAYQQLRDQIENLQFQRAAQTLATI